MSVDAALSTSLLCLVFGKMFPGKKTPEKSLREYFHLENYTPQICPPGKLPPENLFY